jgi:hypothetical protein
MSKPKSPYPDYPVPHKCEACTGCWYDPERNVCLYQGPFTGYHQFDEKKKIDRSRFYSVATILKQGE